MLNLRNHLWCHLGINFKAVNCDKQLKKQVAHSAAWLKCTHLRLNQRSWVDLNFPIQKEGEKTRQTPWHICKWSHVHSTGPSERARYPADRPPPAAAHSRAHTVAAATRAQARKPRSGRQKSSMPTNSRCAQAVRAAPLPRVSMASPGNFGADECVSENAKEHQKLGATSCVPRARAGAEFTTKRKERRCAAIGSQLGSQPRSLGGRTREKSISGERVSENPHQPRPAPELSKRGRKREREIRHHCHLSLPRPLKK